ARAAKLHRARSHSHTGQRVVCTSRAAEERGASAYRPLRARLSRVRAAGHHRCAQGYFRQTCRHGRRGRAVRIKTYDASEQDAPAQYLASGLFAMTGAGSRTHADGCFAVKTALFCGHFSTDALISATLGKEPGRPNAPVSISGRPPGGSYSIGTHSGISLTSGHSRMAAQLRAFSFCFAASYVLIASVPPRPPVQRSCPPPP